MEIFFDDTHDFINDPDAEITDKDTTDAEFLVDPDAVQLEELEAEEDLFSSVEPGEDPYEVPEVLAGPGAWPQFDPAQAGDQMAGDPTTEMQHWHLQSHPDSCAIAIQGFALESLLGQPFVEETLCQEAFSNGWYTPGIGTPVNHMGNLLEFHGIGVTHREGCSLDDLHSQLDQYHKVFVALDSGEIRTPGWDPDDYLASYWGLPGQGATHAVQVIGIDETDPTHPTVILNDSSTPNGQGMMVPLGTFMGAWEDSGFYMVHTTGHLTEAGSSLGIPHTTFAALEPHVGWAYPVTAGADELILSNDGNGYLYPSDHIAGTNPYEPA